MWRPGRDGGGIEVALVHRPRYDDWSLPKGKLARGEHVLLAARREIAEETGHDAVLGRPLPTQHYRVASGRKEVRYWAARALDGGVAIQDDVDEVAWLPPGDAAERLTWERDAGVLDAFAAGPVGTVPLVLLRHATAVQRLEWADPDDRTRPLDARGQLEASGLAPLLECFAPERVLTSDTRRTIDTVEPYAARCGARVELEPVFSQEGFLAHPDAALDRARSLLRSSIGTVLCTHRPVLPWLLATLFERSAQTPPQDLLGPADFWVLHLAGGRIAAWERHRPGTC